jgi:20S proteasome alpha/beta subunit
MKMALLCKLLCFFVCCGRSLILVFLSFHTDPSGTYIQYEAKAIGAGSEGAQSSLQEHYTKVCCFVLLDEGWYQTNLECLVAYTARSRDIGTSDPQTSYGRKDQRNECRDSVCGCR